MGKRYWLRGLVIGIVVYCLVVLFMYGPIYEMLPDSRYQIIDQILMTDLIAFSPIVVSGLLIGWLFRKPQKLQ